MVTVHCRESFLMKRAELPRDVRDELTRKHKHYFFEERVCDDCELKPERLASETKLTPTCEECDAFKGGAILAENVKIGETNYFKVPIGAGAQLKATLNKHDIEYSVKRRHPTTPMKRPIKFIGELRGKHQPEAVKAFIRKKRGVIRSPPRSGKTVLSTAAICKLGLKTIIMASQKEWLDGFLETFIGSDTQPALTNCRRSQIGFAKTWEDFQKYDVCLVTVQTFYRKPKLLRKIRDLAAVLVVDEVHTSAAPEFANVINSLNAQYMIGLSGTPERKDGRHSIMRDLIGQDIYVAKVKQLRPRVMLTTTEYERNTKGQQLWVRMVGALEKDPKRLKLIAQTALKDVKAGHMILIPFAQITPIKALVKAINIMAGRTIAQPFYGGLKKDDRRKFLQQARTYKVKILVGNIKLLSTGTNIPRASAIYEVTMSSNIPNATQRFARILTPYDDKPQPIIRYFLDDSSVRMKCMRTEFWQALSKVFNPIISDTDMDTLKKYFSGRVQVKGGGKVQM
jgi:superfamily II DNA or RNA helicase